MKNAPGIINGHQQGNVSFGYLYQDASNYKDKGWIVLRGDGMSIGEANKRLASAFDSGLHFIADQIEIPEVFLWNLYPVSDDDHCWHEFEGLERTTAQATDPRTLTEFVEAVENSAKRGWREFEPSKRKKVEWLA